MKFHEATIRFLPKLAENEAAWEASPAIHPAMFSSLFYLHALSLLWALAICPLSALLLKSCVTLPGAANF